MKRILILIGFTILITLFMNCKSDFKKNKSGAEINKITVAFSGYGCESICPYIAVCIDSSLNVYYYGGRFSELKGYYKGTISKDVWDSIQSKFNKFLIKGIDSTSLGKTDCPSVQFIIHNKQSKKEFINDTGEMTETDLDILYWFAHDLIKNTKLTPTDSINFETTA